MEHCVNCCAGERMSEDIQRQFMRILEDSFPPNERRITSGQLALMDNALYQIRTLQESEKILALMAVWMLDGMIFLEHFAVAADCRSQGIGGRMLDALTAEAEKQDLNLILEVEMPTDELTRRRIGFYQRHGMHFNEYEYYQMPLREGDTPTEMRLMSSRALSEIQFQNARSEIYRHVYGIREI